MAITPEDRSHIQGWGADLDRANRPAVPMERTPPRLDAVRWNEPVRQLLREEVLVSRERPDITPVFGTSVPPSGLSGKLRRKAFDYTENNIKHWLMLMAADRVNVLEGRAQDLRQMSRTRPVATVALLGGIALVGMWALRRRNGAPAEQEQNLGDGYLDHAT